MPLLNELHGPTVHTPPTSSTHCLLHPPSLFSASPLWNWALRIHSGPQIKSYYIFIFHIHSFSSFLYILLTLSFSYLSPLTSSVRILAISLTALRKGHLMWGMMQVQEHRFFFPPFLRCNPIRWAADIRLKSHRLHGCFYVQVEHFSSLRCLL